VIQLLWVLLLESFRDNLFSFTGDKFDSDKKALRISRFSTAHAEASEIWLRF
jgi:hypothetical protein